MRNGTFERTCSSEYEVTLGSLRTAAAVCTGGGATCACGLSSSPLKLEPTTTTVSGFPASCA